MTFSPIFIHDKCTCAYGFYDIPMQFATLNAQPNFLQLEVNGIVIICPPKILEPFKHTQLNYISGFNLLIFQTTKNTWSKNLKFRLQHFVGNLVVRIMLQTAFQYQKN